MQYPPRSLLPRFHSGTRPSSQRAQPHPPPHSPVDEKDRPAQKTDRPHLPRSDNHPAARSYKYAAASPIRRGSPPPPDARYENNVRKPPTHTLQDKDRSAAQSPQS